MSSVLIGPQPAALSGNAAMYQSKINGGKRKSNRNKRNKSRRNKSMRRHRRS